MAGSSATLHESPEKLGSETIDRHRATVSIMEELEAIDWYDQRAAATDDTELRQILEHNRDDEKEHASMALEWLRRHDSALDEELRRYLFTEGSIVAKAPVEVEPEEVKKAGGGSDTNSGSLGIGSLRPEASS
jgi:ferritin-like protein